MNRLRRWLGLVGVIFAKEMTDASRDRRSLFSALLYPFVGPLMIVLSAAFIADMEREAEEVEIPVAGAE